MLFTNGTMGRSYIVGNQEVSIHLGFCVQKLTFFFPSRDVCFASQVSYRFPGLRLDGVYVGGSCEAAASICPD